MNALLSDRWVINSYTTNVDEWMHDAENKCIRSARRPGSPVASRIRDLGATSLRALAVRSPDCAALSHGTDASGDPPFPSY